LYISHINQAEKVDILSAEGKLVTSYTNVRPGQTGINVEQLPKGAYLVRANHGNTVSVFRFIKK
jgi:hypothetical protein